MQDTTCSHCGCVLGPDEVFEFDDEIYCEDCLNDITVVCDHCGRRISREDDNGGENISLCSRCYSQWYVTCERCGRVLLEEDAYYDSDDEDRLCCPRCHQTSRVIRSYYFKPVPVFHGTGARYFGVELEVDGAGENHSNAQQVLNIVNETGELAYCKHDGSLSDGFELVTHPMTLDFHRNRMPWKEALDCLKGMGYRSHQTSTCGLHCHINRTSLGDGYEQQDAAIGRILYFVEKHWEELVTFSRRTQKQLDHWASRYGYHHCPKELLKKAKGGMGRYFCLNLTNEETIEFRLFRGTLKYNSLIAALQLADSICDLAVQCDDEQIQNLSWTAFVAQCTQPELIQYLKERRLYVNDPIESEVEV